MVFPRDPLGLARHPSQLYQAFLEGALLFAIVWWFSAKPRPRWAVGGVFIGERIHDRADPLVFRRGLFAMLFVVGLALTLRNLLA
jgi:uncharacterized membrane protein YfcA